jgi:hypothetical protein
MPGPGWHFESQRIAGFSQPDLLGDRSVFVKNEQVERTLNHERAFPFGLMPVRPEIGIDLRRDEKTLHNIIQRRVKIEIGSPARGFRGPPD